jgi:hypothetical protein
LLLQRLILDVFQAVNLEGIPPVPIGSLMTVLCSVQGLPGLRTGKGLLFGIVFDDGPCGGVSISELQEAIEALERRSSAHRRSVRPLIDDGNGLAWGRQLVHQGGGTIGDIFSASDYDDCLALRDAVLVVQVNPVFDVRWGGMRRLECRFLRYGIIRGMALSFPVSP